MLFSTMTFLYIFLPLVIILHTITNKKWHNFILLAASILFYAWGEPKYLSIMLLIILINYLGAIIIEKFQYKKLSLICTIILNIGIFTYFKYFNFIIDNINNIFHANINVLNIALPIGISFYTFQAITYIADVYKGEVKAQKNIYNLALYICLFPQLIAGPIVKYHDIAEQIESREINFDNVTLGVKRFIIGLSKKVLIANILAESVDKIYAQAPDSISHSISWFGAVAYWLQLYFDFSGYSDMAIGLCLIFGFKIMENFNYPYMSKSITEFWRRWHISLSTFFKQYVYIPIGGSKGTLLKTIRNLGFVFFLTGLWHGAAWTFVIWGIYHGCFIILERLLGIKEFEKKEHHFITNRIMHIYCMVVVIVGLVIFRSETIGHATTYIMNMFGLIHINSNDCMFKASYFINNMVIIAFIAALLCSTPMFKNLIYLKGQFTKAIVNIWLFVLFFLSTIFIASNTYNPFIYFRF